MSVWVICFPVNNCTGTDRWTCLCCIHSKIWTTSGSPWYKWKLFCLYQGELLLSQWCYLVCVTLISSKHQQTQSAENPIQTVRDCHRLPGKRVRIWHRFCLPALLHFCEDDGPTHGTCGFRTTPLIVHCSTEYVNWKVLNLSWCEEMPIMCVVFEVQQLTDMCKSLLRAQSIVTTGVLTAM